MMMVFQPAIFASSSLVPWQTIRREHHEKVTSRGRVLDAYCSSHLLALVQVKDKLLDCLVCSTCWVLFVKYINVDTSRRKKKDVFQLFMCVSNSHETDHPCHKLVVLNNTLWTKGLYSCSITLSSVNHSRCSWLTIGAHYFHFLPIHPCWSRYIPHLHS